MKIKPIVLGVPLLESVSEISVGTVFQFDCDFSKKLNPRIYMKVQSPDDMKHFIINLHTSTIIRLWEWDDIMKTRLVRKLDKAILLPQGE